MYTYSQKQTRTHTHTTARHSAAEPHAAFAAAIHSGDSVIALAAAKTQSSLYAVSVKKHATAAADIGTRMLQQASKKGRGGRLYAVSLQGGAVLESFCKKCKGMQSMHSLVTLN
jgi:hypothetical protein